jgi:phospholipase/carboxylesterase
MANHSEYNRVKASSSAQEVGGSNPPLPGRLRSRPGSNTATAAPGERRLDLSPGRDALLYAPPSYDHSVPAPLAVMLHGARGNASHGLALLRGLADEPGLILLAPESRSASTWDVILGEFGPDVDYIDRALERVLNEYTIDPNRIAIGGFSDGASYALSMGLGNGDLFTHIVAFSPGFMAPTQMTGEAQVFVSHGDRDEVLPVHCSRSIVPKLKRAGYNVVYREFHGGHTVPLEVATEAVQWLTATV